MTVRNNKNKVIQFKYGDDNINPMKTENQQIPLAQMSLEIYSHMAVPKDDTSKSIFTTTYDSGTLKRMKSKKKNHSKRRVVILLWK